MLLPALALLFAVSGTAETPPAPPPIAAASPVRISAAAFGDKIEIEVRNLPRADARAAIDAALAEVAAIEELARPDTSEPIGGIGALNTAAGKGPQAVDPRILPALVRAYEICLWSNRANGPLGRTLYEIWGLRPPVAAAAVPPPPDRVEDALAAAGCDRLTLGADKKTVTLAAGSRVDLGGFVEGHAVDRAVDALQQRGVKNGFVQIGGVQRAFGGGPDGHGWRILIPAFPGMEEPAARLLLRDQAIASTSTGDRPLRIAAQNLLPYLDQRTGLPPQGIVGTVVVTRSAVDAEALAVTLAILGSREGQFRLGSVRPNPSALWFLGSGSGAPLQVEHHWADMLLRSP
jgi:thiamine biosynthesis lipoprotein